MMLPSNSSGVTAAGEDDDDDGRVRRRRRIALGIPSAIHLVGFPLASDFILFPPGGRGERLVRSMALPVHSSPPPVPSPLLPSSECLTQIQTLRIASTQTLIDVVAGIVLRICLHGSLLKRGDRRIRDVRVTELVELHEHDTQDLYALLEDA
ncbi:hypothetical protein Tco_0824705 [Tanacetum coccineum]|uniref:Uncharacterized protein n=1 Tax=Tanacetum coccineum TaxID=301880 RepID=A0ABQ5AML2_9ASTR